MEDVTEVLSEDHQVVVGSSEGDGDDGGAGADASIGHAEHHLALHPLKFIVEFYHGIWEFLLEEGGGIQGIWDGFEISLVQDENYVLRPGAVPLPGLGVVGLQGGQVGPQEALAAPVWRGKGQLHSWIFEITCVTDEVVSWGDRLPYWQTASDLMALFLLPGGQEVPPDTQVRLHPLLHVLDQAVDPHGRPVEFDIIHLKHWKGSF